MVTLTVHQNSESPAETADWKAARSIRGPFVHRICASTRDGFRWAEYRRRPGGAYLGNPGIATLFRVVPRAGVIAVPPRVHGHDLATWHALPTPGLLCDRLFDHGSAGEEWWRTTLESLASFLGALHRLPVNQVAQALPDRTTAPAWMSSDSEAGAGIRKAAGRLPLHLTPLLSGAAGRTGPTPRRRSIVHGRFSTGVCALTSPVAVLGWREAGVGDPLSDVAYLLGEVLEAAALTGMDAPRLHGHLQAFLFRYQAAAGDSLDAAGLERLTALTARRVIDHYAQAHWAFGPDDAMYDVLPKVERQWLVLREVTDP
ncbi:phosphotransferase [Microbispora amethystogenes]|uniref:phosphotransferase n=1 Tax=Microbispora amethystogenes TaxID=1427754 RepID=UPI0033E4CE44